MSAAPVLVAPDKFKGTFTAAEVAGAIAAGLRAAGRDVDELPVADGGEGTAAALGATPVAVTASDPLGRPVEASYAWLDDGATAIVEAAAASGLWRLAPERARSARGHLGGDRRADRGRRGGRRAARGRGVRGHGDGGRRQGHARRHRRRPERGALHRGVRRHDAVGAGGGGVRPAEGRGRGRGRAPAPPAGGSCACDAEGPARRADDGLRRRHLRRAVVGARRRAGRRAGLRAGRDRLRRADAARGVRRHRRGQARRDDAGRQGGGRGGDALPPGRGVVPRRRRARTSSTCSDAACWIWRASERRETRAP